MSIRLMHAAPDDLITRRGIVGACEIAAQLGELDEAASRGGACAVRAVSFVRARQEASVELR